MRKPCLVDVTLDEARELINSLTDEERKFYSDADADLICSTAVYIKGVKVDGKLAGIGGLTSVYGVAYNAFYAVKTAYQDRGIGRNVAISYRLFACKQRLTLLLTIVSEDNIPAMKILEGLGSRFACSYKGKRYAYVSHNTIGDILGKLLPMIVRVYFSPIGVFLQKQRKRKYSHEP